jgi:hypothetical protein
VATPVVSGVPCTNLFGIALGNACVIVVQASPEAGAVDLYVDGQLALASLTYGTLNDFVPVTAGERQLQIVPSGAAVADAVIDTTVFLEDGIAYEVAAVGAADEIAAEVYPVSTTPLPEATARVRVVHASPDAPAVDLAVTGGNVLLDNVAYRDISGYVEIPAGTYELEARVAATSDLALPLPGTLLAPNIVHTIYVLGLVEDASLGAMIVPVLISPDITGAVATPVS